MKREASACAIALAAGLAAGQARGQIVEDFDNVGLLPGLGWTIQNSSADPAGPAWFQGDAMRFAAHSGAPDSYAASDFLITAGAAGAETISGWLVSPPVFLMNDDTITFYTRTEAPVAYPDRLQLRLSTQGAASVIGTGPNDVGTFTTLLLEINPTYTTLNGYPTVWTQYSATISGLSAVTSCRVAFRYFVEQGGPQGSRSNYIGLDSVVIGNAVTGRCCMPDATCTVLTSSQCTGVGGVYGGDNTTCAAFNCPAPPDLLLESGDAGELPGAAQIATGSGVLTRIRGALTAGDVDMYRIKLCDPAQFSATTVGGTGVDTQLFLFAPSGLGITANDDDPATGLFQSTLSAMFTGALQPGEALLAVSSFDRDPTASGLELWFDQPTATERPPDGPGAASPLDAWNGTGQTSGAYTITLTGACYVGTPNPSTCYPNCDNSTVAPVLNVADFTCFLQQFAAGNSYANCDNSTVAPVLNVADFTCFLQQFAAGCP